MMVTDEVAFMTDGPDQVQRWTAKRRAAVVLSMVKRETSAGGSLSLQASSSQHRVMILCSGSSFSVMARPRS